MSLFTVALTMMAMQGLALDMAVEDTPVKFGRNLKVKPVRVLHPSGSGGRTLGEMAGRAGVPKPRDSATMPCQSFCDWTYSELSKNKSHITDLTGHYSCKSAVHSCEAMASWYANTGYRYGSSEMLLPEIKAGGKGLCPQFQYVIPIRHPLERIMSEMVKHSDDINTHYEQMVGPVGFFLAKRGSAMRTTAAVSNYYIRALLGDSVFFLPVDGITQEHYEQAKALLTQFDAVIPLGLLDTTYAHDVLRKIPAFQNITERRQSHVHTDQLRSIPANGSPSVTPSPEAIAATVVHGWEAKAAKMGISTDVLKRNNKYDLMLYEWALRRFMQEGPSDTGAINGD